MPLIEHAVETWKKTWPVLSLLPGKCLAERKTYLVESDVALKKVRNLEVALAGSYRYSSLSHFDRFRELARLCVRSSQGSEKLWIFSIRKLYRLFRELDRFSPVADRGIGSCRKHPGNIDARMGILGS